ncbi:hydrolase [Lactiplantibacillus plantarum]|uniref:alpha/beta hydrolase n=1 Tax=Lactiplantibacillus plantarum TaxID=1590 RepID=UPI0007877ADA|nr:alpha/beta hydrolase [Lactiplantibacillus plantarum]KYK51445.1 hydrolase [Lactiplantibacillus plantarum]KYM68640.1 hydrolase [Lactiplantibacillus plantarum]
MRRIKIIKIMAIISATLVVGIGSYWQHRLTPLRKTRVAQTSIPTIFVGGDYARAFSTDGFVHRLTAAHLMTKGLVVHVSHAGHVTVQQFGPLKNNPTIQVIFADNHHAKRQARQFATVMQGLAKRYHVTRYNAVGHSSGGNIIFDYLTAQVPQRAQINKFVTIGSTYPGLTTQQLNRLPRSLPILNIAGHVWHTSGDGGVNLQAVLKFSHQLLAAGWSPKTKIIHGSPLTASHSMLHINPQVDLLIIQFLYGN